MKKAIVTLHPHYNGSRIALVRWLRNNLISNSQHYYLKTITDFADTLLEGKPLEFANVEDIYVYSNQCCNIEVEDDEAVEAVVPPTVKDEYLEMAKYGANGNTLLAIKFCQDVVAGKDKFLRHVACGS